MELEHQPLGDFRGVIGLQHSDVRSGASGVEGFLPRIDTRAIGLFIVENYDPGEQWHFEVGARHDWLHHQPRDDERDLPGYRGTAASLSAAATWRFRPGWAVGLSVAQSGRLPHEQELYARGIHLATNTYECGLLPHALTCGGAGNDAALKKERSRNVGLSLRKTAGAVTFNVGAYYNRISNYIFADTLDQFEEFRLIKYSQRDASFRGLEGELTWQVNRAWSVTGFGDIVRARFSGSGGNVPRIPSARYGARVHYAEGQFSASVELYRVTRQNRVASFETTTPGYTMLDAGLSYWLPGDRTNLFVRGGNLLNQQVWNHASYLAQVTPLPGRNVVVGVTHRF